MYGFGFGNVQVTQDNYGLQFHLNPFYQWGHLGWKVSSIYGRGDAVGIMPPHSFGNKEQIVFLSKWNKPVGYIRFIHVYPDNYILIEPYLTEFADIQPLALIQLIQSAITNILSSEVGYLFIQPFPLTGRFRVGNLDFWA